MSDASEPNACDSKSPNCCAPGKPCCPFTRWLPFVLLVAAATLYFRDVRAARARADAANEIRRTVVNVPLAAVAIGYKVAGREVPFLTPLPAIEVTNVLSAIASAEPVKFPKGVEEGEELEIHLVQTNRMRTVLQAARIESDPEALYFRLRKPVPSTKEGEPGTWAVSLPARAPTAGALIGGILGRIKAGAEKLPPEADMIEKMTNSAARAARQAAATNNVGKAFDGNR